MICGKLRNLLTTSISSLTKFTECFMVYCFPSKAPSQESNPETRAYTTGLLLRAVRFRLVGPVYSQFQSLPRVQIDRHQCSRLPYIYHWKRTYRTLWFRQKSQIPPVYGNKWKREWKGSLPLAFPDAQMYLFRRFCRRIRLPNAHCVKKISELSWRSGDVLDSNVRSTGPLKIIVFFPHSDKAKSNFGRDDHLTIHCGESSDMNPYVCDVGRPRRQLFQGLVSR